MDTSRGQLALEPQVTDSDTGERLAPYVPRLALEWLRDSPDAVHRRLEGTVLFVDVSGFTALTERLAARGKVGAEEITDVIGTVFGELLGIAASYGADMVKWGGDAALLFFPEPRSAARACRAAVLMSQAMRRTGRLRTSVGRVTLEVSIGAHTGAFDFFLLGDRHRELIVTGPAATLTAHMETVAQAGEVVVTEDTARALEPSVLGPSKLDGVLLIAAPAAEPVTIEVVSDVARVDVAPLFPAPTRRQLLGGGEQAEHRQATVAFIEFSGVDVLTLVAGAGAVAAALDPIVRSAQEAAERYGTSFHGTDIGPDGGKIILLGGVPVLRGNDAERVLRSVHDVVANHPADSPIGLRVGVNAGRVFVFAHEVGLGHRRIFSITGDAVNLAARVMGHAADRQVLATADALDRARNPFDTEPVTPFMVKGKTAPIIASAVGAPRTAVSEIDEGLAFVGRDRELEQLLEQATTTASGLGSLVEVIGAPGIGKSRLVSEAIDRWGLHTLRVACEEYGSATPYLPFRRIFRRLLGSGDDAAHDVVAGELRRVVAALAPELEPFLPLLADVVDVPMSSTREVDELEPRFRRGRLEQCVVQLLRAFLPGPSAFVFEDAHAIDEASESLLSRVALEVTELPLLVVLTRESDARAVLPDTARHLVIELAPLEGDDALRMATGGTGRRLAPAEIAAIVERADGNPLFLRELLRSAGLAGGVEGLPESLEPLLAAEIDRLSPSDRRILRAAAVLGAQFDPVILIELLEEGLVDDGVWVRLGTFVAPTAIGWRFAHGLMRDAAYEGLSFRRRKELHARAARAIETRTTAPDESADLLSLHYLHAEDYARAWPYSRLAGDRARALWANSEAATFYTRALEAASHLGGTVSAADVEVVAEGLGDVCELTGNYERAARMYAQARGVASRAVERARLLRKTGVLHERQGRYREALGCYTRGRRLVHDGSRSSATERAELNLASAGIRSRQGRYRECAAFAIEAANEATRARHRSGLAHALYLQHMMSVYLGAPKDDFARRALAIFEELDDLIGQGNVLNNLGIGAYYRGEWVVALDHYERSRQARLRAGDVIGAATEENNVAEILSDQADFEGARSLFESARSTWLAAGYRVGAALATSNLGTLEARAGNLPTGRQLLEQAIDDFREIRSPVFRAETELRLVDCGVLEGDFTVAMAAARDLLDGVRGRPGLEQVEAGALRLFGTATALAALAEGAGEVPGESTQALDAAIDRATSLDVPYELALCLSSRAALVRLRPHDDQLGLDATKHGATTAADGPSDHDRAEAIFAVLGVRQAVITWSTRLTGAPIFAREDPSEATA